MSNVSKICKRCEVDRPASEFSRSTRAKSGLQTYCKPCHADMQRNDPGRTARYERYKASRPAENMHRHLRRRADKHGVECCSMDVFSAWFSVQVKSCVYCGDSDATAREKYGHALHVDRKEAEYGYVPSNICLACHRCNVVKSRYLTHEQMLEIAQTYFLGVERSNSHDDLMAALEDMMDWARCVSDEYIDGGDLREDYRQALADARHVLLAARGAA